MKIGIMHVMPAVENAPEDEVVKAWGRLLRSLKKAMGK
jgi:hypothetical protein